MAERSICHYAASYTPIPSGYMGRLLDWPEVVTEGASLEECRELLFDALHEMILAYRQLSKAMPEPRHITEQLTIEA